MRTKITSVASRFGTSAVLVGLTVLLALSQPVRSAPGLSFGGGGFGVPETPEDLDNDGVLNESDNCPTSPTFVQQFFSKANGLGTSVWDEITPNLKIARNDSDALINLGSDAIQWANGTCAAPTSTFYATHHDLLRFLRNSGSSPSSALAGSDQCLSDTTTGKKYDITFVSWSSGRQGGFSYNRLVESAGNPDQTDTDGNGRGDICDPIDLDGDGLWNINDNCPVTFGVGYSPSAPAFVKPDGAGLTVFDTFSPELRIARDDSRGLFNLGTDSVQWAAGSCGTPTSQFYASHDSLLQNQYRSPVSTKLVGQLNCLRNVTTGAKYTLRFISWTGSRSGGGFSYELMSLNPANPDQTDTDGNGAGDICDVFDLDLDGVWNVNDNCPTPLPMTFTQPGGVGASVWDEITPNLRITRNSSRGLYNLGSDSIKWAKGTCAAPTSGFDTHDRILQNNFRSPVSEKLPGNDLCLRNLTTGVDYDIHFLSWGGQSAGGFSYRRLSTTAGNPDQTDSDNNGRGDVCDPVDLDSDGLWNTVDNCPTTANVNQADTDGNGAGDACDPFDLDGDGVWNINDNCPTTGNTNQLDGNNNGVGAVCDATERFLAAVPWSGNESAPHQVFSGGSLPLQAVFTDGAGGAAPLVSGSWDPGDGSGVISIAVSNSYVLEATHQYSGFVGQPFTATITVTDDVGDVYTDTMRIVIAPNNRETQVNMAIDKGLWNLHKTQTRMTSDGAPSTQWTGGGYNMTATANAAQAFQINGHRESGDPAKNPYVRNVANGLRYILSEQHGFLQRLDVPLQNGNDPDSNGNGYGLWVNYGGHASYLGGSFMDAIVASGTQNKVAEVGQATFVRGRTYRDIVQDMIDGYSYGMADNTGGWHYSFAGTTGGNDTSASHWWSIGVLAAENWGLDAPQWVKDIQWNVGVPLMQNAGTGVFGYTDSQNPAWDSGTNTTAAGLILMNADDISQTNARFTAASNYLDSTFAGSTGNFYTMFQLTKGMRTALDDAGNTAPIGLLNGTRDWYAAYADHLVANQDAAGAFTQTAGSPPINQDMATAWGIIILSPSLFELPPTAVCAVGATIVCQAGAVGGCNAAGTNPYASVTFDGSQSITGDNPIASYSWDFQDSSPLDPQVSTSHSFSASGTFNVSLKVTDTKGNFSTVTCPVEVRSDALPPVANPGGPYDVCPNRAGSVVLDGSGSIGRGSHIVSYAWDWTNPISFSPADQTDAAATPIDLTAYFQGLAPGTYNVGLRVTDDTVPAFTDTRFTTVTVHAAGDAACNAAPVATTNSYTVAKNSSMSGNVVTDGTADSDPDGDTFSASVASAPSPAGGSFVLAANGAFTYTPPTGFDGTVTFSYRLTDQYGGVSNTATVTIVVTPALPTTTVTTGGTFVFDGAGHGSTCTVSSSDGAALTGTVSYAPGGASAPVNVGSYAVTCDFAGDATHLSSSGTATITITPAPTTTVVTCTPSVVYTGGAQEVCTAAVTGAGGLNEAVTPVTYTANTNVGTAGASATYAGDANHSGSTGTGGFAITPATAVATATGGTFTYDGLAHGGGCSVAGVNGEVLAGTTSYSTGGAPVNAGTHTVTCTFAGTNNYAADDDTADIVITPAAPVATATGGTHVYDGLAHGGTCAVAGVNGEVLAGTTTYSSGAAPTNVGTYTVTCAIAAGGNYAAASDDDTITITPAAPVATATGGTHVYDGLAHGGTCAVAGVNGEVLAGTTTYSSGGAPTNVGTYTVTCAIAEGGNYAAASDDDTITITPAAPVATATGGTHVYDGLAHGGTCAVAGVNGEVLAGTTTYSSGGAPTNVGTYTVTCAIAAGGNYAAASDDDTITITPAAPVATATGGTHVYDGLAHGGTCAVAGVNGEVLAGTTTYSSGGAPTNVGTYTVTCAIAAGGNYAAASDDDTITITPATPVATATGGTHVYDGLAHGGTCAVAGVNGEVLAGTTSYSSGGAPVDAGTQTVTCSFTATQNYSAASDTADIVITPAAAVATATGGTFTYDGQPHGGGCLVAGVNGEVLAGTTSYSSGGAPVNAGNHTVTCTFAATQNYTADSDTAGIVITPAAAVATATGGTFTYDGQPHGGGCSVAGANGEVLAGTTSYSSGGAPVNAGSHEVTCTFTATQNYAAASDTADIVITPAAAVATATGGTFTYDGQPHGGGCSVAGVNGEVLAGTTSYSSDGAPVSAGTQTVTCTFTATQNYTADSDTADIVINQATLTVSANSYTRSYLAPDPTLAGTLTGVVAGDGITASYSSTGTGSQVPGVYPTVPALADPGGKLANYAVTTNNGTLTITNTAPVCSVATASPASIWPPNHKWVKVSINGVTDIDGGPLTFNIVSIFQDEPTNTKGDGNTAFDGKGVGTNTAWVRAERVGDRSGHNHRKGDGCDHEKRKKGHKDGDRCEHERDNDNGNGRVYHITFTATDSAGLACTGTVTVGVPHDQRGTPAVDDGPLFDSTVPTAPAGHGDGDGCKDNDHEHGRPDRDEDRDHYDGDKCDHSKGAKGHKKGDNCDHEKHVKDAKDRDDKNKRDEDDKKGGRG